MVRAILADTKTQTRRPVKGQALEWLQPDYFTPEYVALPENGLCPYGAPGDRLWVKETWRPRAVASPWDLSITYAADGEERVIRDGEFGERDWNMPKAAARGNVSPLFMPRWASRITLEITGVRVERLQDISEADALAEGIERLPDGGYGLPGGSHYHFTDPRESYWSLWEAINGPGSVEANPWVWAVEFSRAAAATGEKRG